MRRGAIRSVLSERLREGGLVIVESFELTSHKTKDFTATLEGLGLNKRLLVVDSASNGNLALSSRNLQEVTLVSASGVNVYDLLTHEQIALTRDAAVQLEKQLSNARRSFDEKHLGCDQRAGHNGEGAHNEG
jgi:large subunit ribosomal protein L4